MTDLDFIAKYAKQFGYLTCSYVTDSKKFRERLEINRKEIQEIKALRARFHSAGKGDRARSCDHLLKYTNDMNNNMLAARDLWLVLK